MLTGWNRYIAYCTPDRFTIEDCVYTTDGDTSWDVPEENTISEGANVDLCDGTSGGCDVEVTITKIGVGNDSDKIIGVTNAYADANN